MKRIIKSVFLVTFCLCHIIISCTKEEFGHEEQSTTNESIYRLSPEQAQKNALEFINSLNGTTRSKLDNDKIGSVKAISASNRFTRSSANESINLDTLFYVVNFENDNGFVIASSDKREIPVFAYVEEGTYEDIDSIPDEQERPQMEENNGYLSFICNLQELVINNRTLSHKDPNNYDLLIYDGNIIGGDMPPINSPETINEVQQPLLLTKWGQNTYNDYCNGCPTGCVITAVSQIRQYVGGHAWIVDGYIHQECRGRRTDYLHCNWGWHGDKNGYFLAGVFDSDSPAFDDTYNTRSGNYKYNLEYSTFCK